ncbi:MAG: OmpA family protein [Bacteroidota bacterium]
MLSFLFFSFTFQAQTIFFQAAKFNTDQDTLTLAEKNDFERQVSRLRNPISHYKVHLIGHTDDKGSLSYNQDLSRRRAIHVQSILLDLGLPQEQIKLDYRAFLSPTDQADNEAARAKNRRVDIILEPWLNHVSNDFHIVNTQQEITLDYSRSKTKIKIPTNAFIDRNGKPYKGDVLISYREFQDYADFMMSDLPMNFNWEGEKAYFNSTGMFEMRAYDMQQRELKIAPEKRIELAFEQREVLDGTELWSFNETDNRWQSGNSFVDFEDNAVIKVLSGSTITRLGESELYFPDKLRGRTVDTIKYLQDAHALMGEIFTDIVQYNYHYVPQLDYNNFRDRTSGRLGHNYAGTDYIGHLPFNLIYDNLDYYNINLEENGVRDKRKMTFKINDLSNKNPELASLIDVVWETNHAKFKKENGFDLTEKRYADIRLIKFKRNVYTFRLKHKGRLIFFKASPIFIPDESLGANSLDDRYKSYSRVYRKRQKEFDLKLTELKERTTLLTACIQLLIPKNIPNDDQLLDAAKIFLGTKSVSYAHTRPTFDKSEKIINIKMYHFLCKAAHFFKPQLNRNHLNRDEWRRLMQDYDPEIVGDVPIYVEMYIALENSIPVLRLGGLGIFNLDVLKRFKEEKRLLASYRTQTGETIDLSKVEVVNHRLNGLLRFDGDEIYLDLGSPTTIVAHAVDGKVYYFSPKDFEQINLRREDSYTFVMQELGNYVAKPELVRNLLANGL